MKTMELNVTSWPPSAKSLNSMGADELGEVGGIWGVLLLSAASLYGPRILPHRQNRHRRSSVLLLSDACVQLDH